MPAEKENKAPTTEQLRHRIDSGAARDKVDHPDLAAAPLGTDDEAAGAPPSAQRRTMSKRPNMSEDGSGFPEIMGRDCSHPRHCYPGEPVHRAVRDGKIWFFPTAEKFFQMLNLSTR